MADPQPQQLNIKSSDETLRGQYSTAMQVTHSQQEIVLDFFNLLPPQAQLVSRIITSPAHAKQIAAALTQNIQQYEKQYGPLTATPTPGADFGFTTPGA